METIGVVSLVCVVLLIGVPLWYTRKRRNRNMLNHYLLWDWLSEHPDKDKFDWPEWDHNGGSVANPNSQECFACDQARMNCKKCPLVHMGVFSCTEPYTSFSAWLKSRNDPDRRSFYAKIIRDSWM